MKLRRQRNSVPGLNTTSTADISFMLLVFFLVTTSMYVDKGLQRQLPPKDKKEKKELSINSEDVMSVTISSEGELRVNDSLIAQKDLESHLAEFILRRGKDHVIMLDAAQECEYSAYFNVQESLGKAYRDVREKAAVTKYGHYLDELTSIDRDAVLQNYPQRVAENYHEQESAGTERSGR